MKNTYIYWIAPAAIIAVLAFGIVWWIRLDTSAPTISKTPTTLSTTTDSTTTTPAPIVSTPEPTPPASHGGDTYVGTYGAPSDTTPSMNQDEVFTANPIPPGTPLYSNVVGYFSYGAFVAYVPDWFVDHWKMTEIDTSTDAANQPITASSTYEINTLSPRDYNAPRTFTDIIMNISPLDETSNAEYQYQEELSTKIYGEKWPIMNKETLVNRDQNGYIYHVQRFNPGTEMYTDLYFVDGYKKTARIEFSVTGSADYLKFSPKVKEFVEGLGEGKGRQG